MPVQKISLKTRQIVAGISVFFAFLTFLVPMILVPNYSSYVNEMMLAAFMIVLVPSAVLDYVNQKWVDRIVDQLPLLVRGVSESQETGMTIIKAFEKVSEDKMIGEPLAGEVRRIVVQMSWGTSFEDALENFKRRIGSPVVSRFCALVLEASKSGGYIKKVFSATSGFMEEMNQMDKDTTSQMRPYILIIYVAFFVFVFTAVILVRSFFAPMSGYQEIMANATISGISGYKDFFYKYMIISGVTGGLMAGKIGERRIAGGFKHSIALALVGYIVFLILIPPSWMVIK